MSPKPDYSLHSKKTHGLFIPVILLVLAVLFIISLFLWSAVITVILALLTFNALLGIILGSGMHRAKKAACVSISAALDKKGGQVLDIGSGPGILTVHLARDGFVAIGADIDAKALEQGKKNAAIEGLEVAFQQLDGSSLPWPEGRFDAVTSLNVIHELDDPAKVLSQVHRVLKPGGILAMADMRRGPVTFSVFWFGFFKFLSKKKLSALLDSAGFSDIRITRATAFHHLIVARKGEKN